MLLARHSGCCSLLRLHARGTPGRARELSQQAGSGPREPSARGRTVLSRAGLLSGLQSLLGQVGSLVGLGGAGGPAACSSGWRAQGSTETEARDVADMHDFADFSDNAPSWQELKQLLAETQSRLRIPDADLEAVCMHAGLSAGWRTGSRPTPAPACRARPTHRR